MVLSIPCFLAVAPKLCFFWLFKSAIAAEIASLLTMVALCEKMMQQKVGGGRIPAVVVWWRGPLPQTYNETYKTFSGHFNLDTHVKAWLAMLNAGLYDR